jgi:hypothetical protein
MKTTLIQKSSLLSWSLYLMYIACCYSCGTHSTKTDTPIAKNFGCVKDGEYIRLDTFQIQRIRADIQAVPRGGIEKLPPRISIYKTVQQYSKDRRVGKWTFYEDSFIYKIIYYDSDNLEHIKYAEQFYRDGSIFAKLFDKEGKYEYIYYDGKGNEVSKVTIPSSLMNFDKLN